MTLRSPLLRGACALAFLRAVAAGSPARADEPPPGDAAPDDTVELEEVLVRVPRGEAAADPTAAATVVQADRFAGEAKGVAELVATAPGVAVHEYGGLGQLATVSIRGSAPNGVLVLVDGLPLNTAFGGGVDLSTIPRHWIDRIEVVRGAEGAHYGAGALGGVVNVVTRGGAGGTWSAEAAGGSFGTGSLALERAAGGPGATLLTAASVDRTAGDFEYLFTPQGSLPGAPRALRVRDNNGALRGAGLAKVAAAVGPARLDALLSVSGGHRELAGWPGNETPRDWQDDGRALLAARVAAPGPADGLALAARASARADLLDVRLASLYGGRPVQQRGGAASVGGEAEWVRGPLRWKGLLSAGGERVRADALGTRDRVELAAALSADATLAQGRARLAPAVRVDRVGGFAGVSAKVGGGVRLGGPLALRASAGRTFRAPSLAELYLQQGSIVPNPALRPEDGLGGDAALVAEGAMGVLSAGAHATLYRDLVVYEGSIGRQLKPFNAGRSAVAGIELEGASAPLRRLLGLAASASYTFLATERLRGNELTAGKELPRYPRHRLYARAGISPGPAELHVELHAVGRQWSDARNEEPPIPAASLWNAGGSVRLAVAPELRLGLEVRNALDDRTLLDPIGNPLPGRTVLVTLRAGTPTPEGRP